MPSSGAVSLVHRSTTPSVALVGCFRAVFGALIQQRRFSATELVGMTSACAPGLEQPFGWPPAVVELPAWKVFGQSPPPRERFMDLRRGQWIGYERFTSARVCQNNAERLRLAQHPPERNYGRVRFPIATPYIGVRAREPELLDLLLRIARIGLDAFGVWLI